MRTGWGPRPVVDAAGIVLVVSLMAEFDPSATRRDVGSSIADELHAAGFEGAVEIGQGGFGVVFRCRQPSLDRTVAVKVLTSACDAENLERFLREQRAMGRLTGHPNIVHVLQVGVTDGGSPFIVMDYHPHGSLDDRIRRDGPLPWQECLQVGVKLAGALETAHRFGVLHRDVKPANILLTEYGEPQLTDFGIAHMTGGFHTSAGIVTGSPAFTAPEVLRGEPPGPASDVYSLGATLFCAMTGHAAFERRSGEKVLAHFVRITTHPIPDLRDRGIPDDVCATVERAMSPSPDARPASAAEFGDALRGSEGRHGCPVDVMPLRSEPADRPDATAGHRPGAVSGGQGSRAGDSDDSSVPMPAPSRTGPRRGKAGNLPLNLSSFVDRRHETAEVRGSLAQSRLVTLTGVGGVGKTRLALQVADDSRRAFEDGVWFVELGELHEPGLLVQAISGTLGLQDRSVRPPLAVLTDHLAESRLLLVLDNCEHLVEGVAVLAESLLRSCPGVRILATSREPLGIRGEVVMRVPPLSVPEPSRPAAAPGEVAGSHAVALFEQRALAALPGFTLTEGNAAAVAQICRRLEGLPLPIELAAARLRAMSIEQIVQRLDDKLRLLTLGNRTTPSRQQTLRLSIDWSYDLCTAEERWLWVRLAVFSGGFELDAAEGILGGAPTQGEVLDVVASLVDKSILVREDAGADVRYRLLDTIRDYGREKLHETGEYAQLRRRHRDWYEQLVLRARAEWIGARQVEWIARLEREQPNLRDALEFCLTEADEAEAGMRIATALYDFWILRGMSREGWHWIDRALAAGGDHPTVDRVDALCVAGMLAFWHNDITAGAALTERASDLAARLGSAHASALVTKTQGCLEVTIGDVRSGVANLERAAAAFRGESDLPHLVPTLAWLAFGLELLGDMTRATAAYQQLVALTQARGEVVWRAMALSDYGFAIWQQGDRRRGVEFLEQALRLSREVGSRPGYGWGLLQLAWTSVEALPERAAVLMGAADAVLTGTDNALTIAGMATTRAEFAKRARIALGEKAFTAALKRGRALRVDEAIAYALGEQPRAASPPPGGGVVALTRREQQVAELVAEGLSNKAIADKLVISKRTVDGHVEHVLAKLGFASRTQVAAWVQSRKSDS
ncbi:hypothetical protein GCM10023094_13200 [Rhodococcus olei]|uniref:Non-specific serine/threonine protein kinase n=1 Tax=Rhodococcus olei TaxID=2161675 RepID=A0ABP8NVW6_9NOCA